MFINGKKIIAKYLAAKKLSAGTGKEFKSTVTEWRSSGDVLSGQEFLDLTGLKAD